MMRIVRYLLLMSSFLMVNVSVADEALSLLMDKLKSKSAIQMSYKEMREMELMDKPWQGSGNLYSMSPDIMIREQLHPKRLLMGIIGNNMFYFDPKSETRYQDEFDDEDPKTLSIAVFKALVNADEKLLHRLYKVEFASSKKSWAMNLKPKQNEESTLSIIVSGLTSQQANKFQITQEEGETSTFDLQKKAEGSAVKAIIEQLSKTLQEK